MAWLVALGVVWAALSAIAVWGLVFDREHTPELDRPVILPDARPAHSSVHAFVEPARKLAS